MKLFTRGVVTEWHAEDGWGVIRSDEASFEIWAHFSALEMEPYRILNAGDRVELEYEEGWQDGYDYRALSCVS
jgi:CspA family cold shock protein